MSEAVIKLILRGWAQVMIKVGALILSLGIFTAPALAATHRLQLGTEEGLLAIEPSQLTIAAGDVVTIEVAGMGPHNLIVDNHPEWSHERLIFEPGYSWQQRFDTAGEYQIWCEPHRFAGMSGQLIVKIVEKDSG